MPEVLELPLFDLRRFVVLGKNHVVGENRYDHHTDILERMTNNRFTFKRGSSRDDLIKNRAELEKILEEMSGEIDMGTVLRIIGPNTRNIIEISGSSQAFEYPSPEEILITSQKRQNTLNLFQKNYPKTEFKLVEKHSV